uniref:Uncharacterized protein n=1 Tax=Cucumis melo TaxID=3656 RepID=A0A9I9DWQ6_CUCME
MQLHACGQQRRDDARIQQVAGAVLKMGWAMATFMGWSIGGGSSALVSYVAASVLR